jgi:hypothetical protein
MHKSATKCNETIGKWCKNKHGASKIIDTLETYQTTYFMVTFRKLGLLDHVDGSLDAKIMEVDMT